LKIKEFICSNIKILVLAQISIAMSDTNQMPPTTDTSDADIHVTPTKQKRKLVAPGAPDRKRSSAQRLVGNPSISGIKKPRFGKL